MGGSKPTGAAWGHFFLLLLVCVLAWSGLAKPAAAQDAQGSLASAPVRASGQAHSHAFDGVVQASRQTTLTAQVAGAIIELPVRAGDAVKAGQPLVELDARAAEQAADASDAQVRAASAEAIEAGRELQRQRLLHEKGYVSRAALDRAEARYATARAQAAAQQASAGVSRTQSGFYTLAAPYDAIVADVPVALGDMALPGRTLLTLYDPDTLRVSVGIPQTLAARLPPGALPLLALDAEGRQTVTPIGAHWQPVADPATHTVELRLDLPAGLPGVRPGAFARVWLSEPSAEPRLYVPAASVLRRAELTAVYVIGAEGRPLLRQVRLGRAQGDEIEVLSGLSAGERVALDPIAAGRRR